MPEGDTIYRAAATLHRALAGHDSRPLRIGVPGPDARARRSPADGHDGRARCESSGKHLLMHFSGGLVLRTHMRMHGSWHIYRPGERWRQTRRDMRVLVATADFEAVGFNIPVAEFIKVDPKHALAKHRVLGKLGPDALAADFDRDEASGACARGRRRSSPTRSSTSSCSPGSATSSSRKCCSRAGSTRS